MDNPEWVLDDATKIAAFIRSLNKEHINLRTEIQGLAEEESSTKQIISELPSESDWEVQTTPYQHEEPSSKSFVVYYNERKYCRNIHPTMS